MAVKIFGPYRPESGLADPVVRRACGFGAGGLLEMLGGSLVGGSELGMGDGAAGCGAGAMTALGDATPQPYQRAGTTREFRVSGRVPLRGEVG
jgi:hypothetical protein